MSCSSSTMIEFHSFSEQVSYTVSFVTAWIFWGIIATCKWVKLRLDLCAISGCVLCALSAPSWSIGQPPGVFRPMYWVARRGKMRKRNRKRKEKENFTVINSSSRNEGERHPNTRDSENNGIGRSCPSPLIQQMFTFSGGLKESRNGLHTPSIIYVLFASCLSHLLWGSGACNNLNEFREKGNYKSPTWGHTFTRETQDWI